MGEGLDGSGCGGESGQSREVGTECTGLGLKQAPLCGPGFCILTQNAKQECAVPSSVFEATDVIFVCLGDRFSIFSSRTPSLFNYYFSPLNI